MSRFEVLLSSKLHHNVVSNNDSVLGTLTLLRRFILTTNDYFILFELLTMVK